MPNRLDLTYLPLDQWPELDRGAWASAHAAGGYFDNDGLAANWSRETNKRCEHEYGRLLLFHMLNGTLRNVRRVGQRVARYEDLRGFIEWLRGNIAPMSVVAALGHIAQTIRALDPTFDRELLLRARGRLQQTAKPIRKIDDRLLSPRMLWELGNAMMDDAESATHLSDKHRAILYRDGLLIAFLAVCPLRRRNATALREDEHLEIETGGRGLTIPAEQMKTRNRDFIATLPPVLVERLRRFWTHFRPHLAWRLGTDETVLWLTMRGRSMAAATVSDRIERILFERKGVHFTSHMFRYSAAIFITDVAPDLALLAVGVLGHARFDTTNDSYIRGQQTRAVMLYQDEVAAVIDRGGGVPDIDDV